MFARTCWTIFNTFYSPIPHKSMKISPGNAGCGECVGDDMGENSPMSSPTHSPHVSLCPTLFFYTLDYRGPALVQKCLLKVHVSKQSQPFSSQGDLSVCVKSQHQFKINNQNRYKSNQKFSLCPPFHSDIRWVSLLCKFSII